MNIDWLTYDAPARWYAENEDGRFYHNLEHAKAVTANCLEIAEGSGINPVTPQLTLAAMWHDAVYIPGAPNGVNEEASCAALRYAMREGDVNAVGTWSAVDRACCLIKGTCIHEHMRAGRITHDVYMAILLDADLGSIAETNFGTFLGNQGNIILEMGGDPNAKASRVQSYQFLNRLRNCRAKLYHTPWAIEHWETQAQDNIREYEACVNSWID